MLHTISTTASEISDYNYEKLVDYGFIKIIDITKGAATRWETVSVNKAAGVELLNYSPATSIKFENVIPGATFNIVNEFYETISVTIGSTGTYILDLGFKIESVKPKNSGYTGDLTYSYETNITHDFEMIQDVQIHDYPLV